MAQSAFLGKGMLNVILIVCVDYVGVTAPLPYFCIFINVGLGEAAKRDVGTGENQIPDMASFASGDGWMKLPNGKILNMVVVRLRRHYRRKQ